MIQNLIERLKAWVKQMVVAVKEWFDSVARNLIPAPAIAVSLGDLIVSSSAAIPKCGEWYWDIARRPHTPVFSLYTFFERRQQLLLLARASPTDNSMMVLRYDASRIVRRDRSVGKELQPCPFPGAGMKISPWMYAKASP